MKKKLEKNPYQYELWINGESIYDSSPIYLRNVARMKGGDWAIYACFKSKSAVGTNYKLDINQMKYAKELHSEGTLIKDIAKKLNVSPSCIGDMLRENPWL